MSSLEKSNMKSTESLEMIPIDKIVLVQNIRGELPNVQSLADSMKEGRLENPIRVTENDGCFIVDTGHRRTAAARLLGWESIQAIVSRGGKKRTR